MLYQVEWVPTAAIIALAKKRGMPSDDDSPLDYCEAEDAAQTATAKTFDTAVKLAKEKLEGDYFGQTRIEQLVLVRSRYGDRYDAEAVWHIDHETNPDKDEPDFRNEIDLVLDERIVAV